MARERTARSGSAALARVFTHDFCPGANRYVYWLKEPVGWLILAAAASLLIGLFANPAGWTLAAALVAIIAVGMLWPLAATAAATAHLRPEVAHVHEGEPCRMILSVRNRLPIPIWGLAVEGYLGGDGGGDEAAPTVALASVPPLCTADFPVSIRPAWRGRYPVKSPKLACAFPFGIWTARRALASAQPLTVWPTIYPVSGRCSLPGLAASRFGEGQRAGHDGDPVGVRPFRRGDSPRHIHWAQSARQDEWIVTERSGPQCVDVDVVVDTRLHDLGASAASPRRPTREVLAWRIRIAASLLVNLHASGIPCRLWLSGRVISVEHGQRGRQRILDALTDVPLDGDPRSAPLEQTPAGAVRLHVDSNEDGMPRVRVALTRISPRAPDFRCTLLLSPQEVSDGRLRGIWQEVADAPLAA